MEYQYSNEVARDKCQWCNTTDVDEGVMSCEACDVSLSRFLSASPSPKPGVEERSCVYGRPIPSRYSKYSKWCNRCYYAYYKNETNIFFVSLAGADTDAKAKYSVVSVPERGKARRKGRGVDEKPPTPLPDAAKKSLTQAASIAVVALRKPDGVFAHIEPNSRASVPLTLQFR